MTLHFAKLLMACQPIFSVNCILSVTMKNCDVPVHNIFTPFEKFGRILDFQYTGTGAKGSIRPKNNTKIYVKYETR